MGQRAGSIGKVQSAETTSPAHLEPHHPDLYWYGVHGCESLFTVMGTGRGDYFLSNTVLLGPRGAEVLTKTPPGPIIN